MSRDQTLGEENAEEFEEEVTADGESVEWSFEGDTSLIYFFESEEWIAQVVPLQKSVTHPQLGLFAIPENIPVGSHMCSKSLNLLSAQSDGEASRARFKTRLAELHQSLYPRLSRAIDHETLAKEKKIFMFHKLGVVPRLGELDSAVVRVVYGAVL